MSLVRATRTSTTRACLATDDDPVTAWERQSDEVKRLAEWIEGKEEVHIKAPGHRHQARRRGPHLDPVRGHHNMPDGEFFTGPGRGLGGGRGGVLVPGHLRRPRGRRACSFRFEGGKVVDASAERGEEFLIEMLDTDDGARRLGELGHRHQLRHRHRHQGDPARREDRRHRAHGDRDELPRDAAASTSSAVHWDMVCDLRQGGSITVDGSRAAARRQVRRLSPRLESIHGRSFQMGVDQAQEGGDRRQARRALHQARARDPVAAREGGGDPEGNPSLALAVQKAKDARMPKDNIERAIAKGTGADQDAEAFEAVIYEGYGPGGVAMLVEALTDNRNRTGSEVRHAFSKRGGSLGEPGSVAWIFEKKGELVVDGARYSEDDLMAAIDAGAEDVVARRRRVRGRHRARATSPRCARRWSRPASSSSPPSWRCGPPTAIAGRGGRGRHADAADRRARGARRRPGGPRQLRRGRRGARARSRQR